MSPTSARTVAVASRVRREVFRREVGDAFRGSFAGTGAPSDEVPPGWEGLAFPFDVPLSDLRPDGSPEAVDLPGSELPRRLYAGEDTEFRGSLRFGETVEQHTRLGRMVEKTGRSGRLVFVDLERDYVVDGAVVVRTTWHDVFLSAAATAATAPVRDETAWTWREPHRLDARQLFRFSALTLNTHRVHYDRDWAREVEGLPDLLVHGPLLRILLLDLARRVAPGQPVRHASVRLESPVYVDTDVHLVGRPDEGGLELAVLGPAGERCATARVALPTTMETRRP